ncbi:MAG: fatty acid desaturase [Pseudomonadota bacterium]
MPTSATAAPASGPAINRALLLFFPALQLFQLVVLPVWLLPRDAAWGWLLLVPVLLSNGWWAFIHDAIHGSLFQDKAANRLAGRLNAILYGAAFDLLRWGHLLHHAYNRTARDRTEVYVAGQDDRPRFAADYYFRLFGGLYLFEVLGALIHLLPRTLILRASRRPGGAHNVVEIVTGKLLQPATLRAVRIDGASVLALHALAFALYGEHAWMLLLALAGRALLISLVDNAFHYATPLDDTRFGRNLVLPAWASALVLHFNLHGAHHLRPNLPWWALPAYHRQSGAGFQQGWFAALFAQLRGPIEERRLRG